MSKNILLFLLLAVSALTAQKTTSDQLAQFDFQKLQARLEIRPEQQEVLGSVHFTFAILEQADTLKIDGRKMEFSEVLLNGEKARFYTDDTGIYVLSTFAPSVSNELDLKYTAHPESAMYFINWQDKTPEAAREVWTQGQGKYTSNWLPSFDELREKLEFDITYIFPKSYQLIANGLLKSRSENDSLITWQYDMEKPMSSYLVGMAAAQFDSLTENAASGVPLKMYFRKPEAGKAEATYRYSKEIFDFFEKEIGVPFPWQNYKQLPVVNFLYGGMENTGTTIFAESLMTDSIGFNDQNYVNVNAHELAHQWFGDLVTEHSGKHHWLNEGFATYYALLAEKEIFGEDYYYWKLYQTAEQLKEASDSGKGQAVLRTGNNSLTYYQKGAWVLHMLREQVGDATFREGIKNYLNHYSFQNPTTEQFLTEMELVSGQDLEQFKKDWLEQSAFKASQALESLKRSEFIQQYLQVAGLREFPLEDKKELLREALDFPVNDYTGQEAVHQLQGENSQVAYDLYEKALESGNLYVRQAVAQTMENIPQTFKKQFEGLLDDDSYITKEISFFKLWSQFPESRAAYFKKLKEVEGFYNKNVRMLWLTLNLVTPDYEPGKNADYYQELAGYAQKWQPIEIQQNAFSYLYQISAFNDASLESVILGTGNPNSGFRNYCRQLLQELLKSQEYRERLEALAEGMDAKAVSYLQSKLSP
ncbi:MAG: M1 family metallopeptidase [Christiangramia sp.]|uniref:M1 family metallopeptidase n=1 Tax=Christiangramia sp. TaxID=1931228 RepID=UPI003242ACCC